MITSQSYRTISGWFWPVGDSNYHVHTPVRCHEFAGDQSVGATLVPIPNTIVKPYSADGTPTERSRESRPSPAPLEPPDTIFVSGGSVFPHTLTDVALLAIASDPSRASVASRL